MLTAPWHPQLPVKTWHARTLTGPATKRRTTGPENTEGLFLLVRRRLNLLLLLLVQALFSKASFLHVQDACQVVGASLTVVANPVPDDGL